MYYVTQSREYKLWSKFQLKTMLLRRFHTFGSMDQQNSPSTMGNLCTTLNALVFTAIKEKKSYENYWERGLGVQTVSLCDIQKK